MLLSYSRDARTASLPCMRGRMFIVAEAKVWLSTNSSPSNLGLYLCKCSLSSNSSHKFTKDLRNDTAPRRKGHALLSLRCGRTPRNAQRHG